MKNSLCGVLVLCSFLFFISCSSAPEETLVSSAFITGEQEILLTTDEATEEIIIAQGDRRVETSDIQQESGGRYRIKTSEALDFTKSYTVRTSTEEFTARPHWKAIDELYTYDGDLGVFYEEESSEFKLWAPLASEVSLLLYENGDDEEPYNTIVMTRGGKGVWQATVSGDLFSEFYTYEVTNYGVTKEVLDPYAKSMSANNTQGFVIGKGAILDPSEIGPELDFASIEGYEKREDAIIWEIHVRDFTSDADIETEAQFGTFAAFSERLDYIESLGVTHIQLLPVMNYALGDETSNNVREWEYELGVNYNWGYDPHSYFAPEGMYSEDPTDPAARVRELKELVAAIHERGLGVTLDVVYNHTARVSIFEDIVPGYYHFMDAAGNTKESYGGGRVGTTHAMARKLVIDSILYWLEEYKVDGYRFDLMGDLDGETVQMMWDQAREINPKVHMVGECWITFAGDDGEEVTPADQNWMDQTNSVACFSDEIRNEVKSGFGSEGQPRFITGGPRNIETIYHNIIAKPSNQTEDDPGDILQYFAAHDNLTLHDVIAYSAKLDPATQEEEIQKRLRLGNTIILTSQGVAFIHAGQEYGRTKQWLGEEAPASDETYVEGFENPYFIHNSYDASDAVNFFDWDKVEEDGIHKETMEYTSGLIDLRRSTDAFRLGTEELVTQNVSRIQSSDIEEEDLIIGYSATATTGETYHVFINADNSERMLRLDLDLTRGTVLVDADESGTTAVSELNGAEIHTDSITISPLTAIIIKTE